ncbi:thioredoxin [Cercophora scortea]|uniref:Thioredoxin n=1 Tax=Cercophora scortea TaxID=314031 RepID=A0AAE0J0K4_9PEZI|nr:thioredoxin [Cercophora scortea]
MAAVANNSKFTIDIEVYSDTACPWCYIGKKSLDRAIKTFRARWQEQQQGDGQTDDVEFNVVWKPFLLFSKARVSGKLMSYQKGAPIISMFGLARAPAVFERLQTAGAAHGITFRWEGKTGNTLDSHKLIMLAAAQPDRTKQDATIDALYRGAFEEGQDPSDRGFLVHTALKLGLASREEEVLDWLDGEEAMRMVAESGSRPGEAEAAFEAARAAARGKPGVDHITAVPSYVVQGRFRVGGMQESEVFVGLFERVLRERERERGARGEGLVR